MQIIDNWSELLEKHSINDLQFSYEYADLYSNPLAFYFYKDSYFGLLIVSINKQYNDFETPYGYGSYISNNYSKDFSELFFKIFKQKAKQLKLIAGIIRFHPLLPLPSTSIMDIEFIRNIAIINNMNNFENTINKKCKNMIKRALRNNINYYESHSIEDYIEFGKLYRDSMKQKQADKFLIFDNQYFEKLCKLPFSYLFVAKKQNKICAATIFLINSQNSYYHLAFSNTNYPGMNNYLVYMGLNKAYQLHSKTCILGGGITNKKDDSILKFKLSFADTLKPFYLGKIIIDNDKYKKLKNINIPEKYKHYFLNYRYKEISEF